MAQMYEFEEVGRLPLPGDNVAIATRRLEAGTTIRYGDRSFGLDHTIMEGHRFAIEPIEAGELLLSWELPFGAATCPIDPGAYVCNVGMLEALEIRSLDFALPDGPNGTGDAAQCWTGADTRLCTARRCLPDCGPSQPNPGAGLFPTEP